jgi:hypothetical protein
VAFRRASLLVGIYIFIVIFLIPVSIFYRRILLSTPGVASLLFLVILSGALFSLGPIVYALMIRRSALDIPKE